MFNYQSGHNFRNYYNSNSCLTNHKQRLKSTICATQLDIQISKLVNTKGEDAISLENGESHQTSINT